MGNQLRVPLIANRYQKSRLWQAPGIVRLFRGTCPEYNEILRFAKNDRKREHKEGYPARLYLSRVSLTCETVADMMLKGYGD